MVNLQYNKGSRQLIHLIQSIQDQPTVQESLLYKSYLKKKSIGMFLNTATMNLFGPYFAVSEYFILYLV